MVDMDTVALLMQLENDDFGDSDDDFEEDIDDDVLPLFMLFYKPIRQSVPSVHNFAERTVQDFTDIDFRKHFRITKETFSILIQEIEPAIEHAQRLQGKQPLIQEKQALITLWYLCNKASMREVALLFGVSKSTVFGCVHSVCAAICNIRQRIIQWPDQIKQQENSDSFEEQCKIPGIIGAIDGSHIGLSNIPNNDNDYINRKGYPSLQLQVISDLDLMIMDCYVGWPGSTHDARVWRNSPVYQEAQQGNLFYMNNFIIGDSAYPLSNYLMTPFRDNGHLTREKIRYNKKLSSARQVVERCFGQLKSRFRRLCDLPCKNVGRACRMITACCVLHNFCVSNGYMIDDLLQNIQQENNVNNYTGIYNNQPRAEAKRNGIVNYLMTL